MLYTYIPLIPLHFARFPDKITFGPLSESKISEAKQIHRHLTRDYGTANYTWGVFPICISVGKRFIRGSQEDISGKIQKTFILPRNKLTTVEQERLMSSHITLCKKNKKSVEIYPKFVPLTEAFDESVHLYVLIVSKKPKPTCLASIYV